MKLGGQMPMQGLPMTDEVAAVQKKARLEAGQETTSLTESEDVYQPSEGAIALNRPSVERFLDDVKDSIGRMDRNSETFLPDATSKLIGHAFSTEYGEEFTQDPGFPQMQAVLARHIMGNPDYRDQVEQLLDMLTIQPGEGEEAAAEEE